MSDIYAGAMSIGTIDIIPITVIIFLHILSNQHRPEMKVGARTDATCLYTMRWMTAFRYLICQGFFDEYTHFLRCVYCMESIILIVYVAQSHYLECDKFSMNSTMQQRTFRTDYNSSDLLSIVEIALEC